MSRRSPSPDSTTTFYDSVAVCDENEDDVDYDSQDFLKSLIYGGLDGIITTFVTVAAAFGAGLPTYVVLILGVAHLFADGMSMGMGDVLSSQADLELSNALRRRERREIDTNLKGKVRGSRANPPVSVNIFYFLSLSLAIPHGATGKDDYTPPRHAPLRPLGEAHGGPVHRKGREPRRRPVPVAQLITQTTYIPQ